MKDYNEMRRLIMQFIEEHNISAYDLVRIGKDLCCCRTCDFFVQHYSKDGAPVDFGHCRRGNTIKSKQPHTQSCGFWTMAEDNE